MRIMRNTLAAIAALALALAATAQPHTTSEPQLWTGANWQRPAARSVTMEDAQKLFADQKWAEAAQAFSAIVQAEPGNALAWFQLGACRHELGQYAEALEAYDRARKAGLRQPGPLVIRRVRAYAKMGDLDSAFQLLRAAVDGGFPNTVALNHADLETVRADARFAEIFAGVNRNARPCEFDPEYRRFDFWLGEWIVRPTVDLTQQAGVNVIELILNQCIVLENWTGASGYAGKSFNLFNRATRKWEQIWVDSVGGIVKFEGEFRDGVLHYYADTPRPDGTTARRHLQFIPQGPDQVRQFSQVTTDGGKTWSVEYDLTYYRKK